MAVGVVSCGGSASIAFRTFVELLCIAACDVAMYGVDRRRLFWWLSMCAILAVISACGAVGPAVSQLAAFVTIDFAMPKPNDARVDRISSAPTLMFGGMVYFSSCYQALVVYQYEDAASMVFFMHYASFIIGAFFVNKALSSGTLTKSDVVLVTGYVVYGSQHGLLNIPHLPICIATLAIRRHVSPYVAICRHVGTCERVWRTDPRYECHDRCHRHPASFVRSLPIGFL